MLTQEQRDWISKRRAEQRVPEGFQAKVFSGDVYGRSSLGQVAACEPDGNIRQGEDWPTRGVTLEEEEASDKAIRKTLGRP